MQPGDNEEVRGHCRTIMCILDNKRYILEVAGLETNQPHRNNTWPLPCVGVFFAEMNTNRIYQSRMHCSQF